MAKPKGKKTNNVISKYDYKIPFSGDDRKKAHTIMNRELKRGTKPNAIYNKLKDAGLGYRKQNLLSDLRYKNATRTAKTPDARKRATVWYLNEFEPMRKSLKVDSNKAKKLYKEMVNQTSKTTTRAKQLKAFRVRYKELFHKEPENE